MREIKLPYIKYLVTPPTIRPAQYVYRPVIPIKLSLGKREVTFDGLVDSGADESTFPAWIAKTLGHNVYKGKKKIFSGIGGSVLAYQHKTHLKINGVKFVANMNGMICHLDFWDKRASFRISIFILIIKRNLYY